MQFFLLPPSAMYLSSPLLLPLCEVCSKMNLFYFPQAQQSAISCWCSETRQGYGVLAACQLGCGFYKFFWNPTSGHYSSDLVTSEEDLSKSEVDFLPHPHHRNIAPSVRRGTQLSSVGSCSLRVPCFCFSWLSFGISFTSLPVDPFAHWGWTEMGMLPCFYEIAAVSSCSSCKHFQRENTVF